MKALTDPELLKAIADLAWPILAATILLFLLPTIIKILKSRGVTIKYGNMELSVQDASDQLRRQIEDMQDRIRKISQHDISKLTTTDQPAFQKIEDVQDQMRKLSQYDTSESATTDQPAFQKNEDATVFPLGRRILWVDDNPTNNAYEIAKLQSDGYDIHTAKSTRAAVELLKREAGKPDIIISDMGRLEGAFYNRSAGIDLIKNIRSQGLNNPIYVYCSRGAEQKYKDEVFRIGGNGITSSPTELFGFIKS